MITYQKPFNLISRGRRKRARDRIEQTAASSSFYGGLVSTTHLDHDLARIVLAITTTGGWIRSCPHADDMERAFVIGALAELALMRLGSHLVYDESRGTPSKLRDLLYLQDLFSVLSRATLTDDEHEVRATLIHIRDAAIDMMAVVSEKCGVEYPAAVTWDTVIKPDPWFAIPTAECLVCDHHDLIETILAVSTEGVKTAGATPSGGAAALIIAMIVASGWSSRDLIIAGDAKNAMVTMARARRTGDDDALRASATTTAAYYWYVVRDDVLRARCDNDGVTLSKAVADVRSEALSLAEAMGVLRVVSK